MVHNYMHKYDLVKGETIQRVANPRYVTHEGSREPNIDWAIIPELRKLISWSALPQDQKEEITAHLDNAENTKLPDDVRMHHFDIAGSRAWIYGMYYGARYDYVDKYIALFVQAGGK